MHFVIHRRWSITHFVNNVTKVDWLKSPISTGLGFFGIKATYVCLTLGGIASPFNIAGTAASTSWPTISQYFWKRTISQYFWRKKGLRLSGPGALCRCICFNACSTSSAEYGAYKVVFIPSVTLGSTQPKTSSKDVHPSEESNLEKYWSTILSTVALFLCDWMLFSCLL